MLLGYECRVSIPFRPNQLMYPVYVVPFFATCYGSSETKLQSLYSWLSGNNPCLTVSMSVIFTNLAFSLHLSYCGCQLF